MDKKQNILKWYPFKEAADVLEIYNEYSIMENCNKNINIHKTNIKQLEIQGQYDYITLIGTYEYAPTIIKEKKSYSGLLKKLKEHLKPNGKILLAIDNRIGVKYLVGGKSNHYDLIFEGLESEIRANKPNLLLKSEIEKFIEEAEFKNYKFYYPLPDYKNTSTIFTDEFLPKSNHSKIVYPVTYEDKSMVIYNEINLIKQICNIGEFVNFTNSYLVEISDNKIENDIKFVNYNIFRKDEYSLILTMKKDFVEKVAYNNKAKEHINKIEQYIENLRKLDFEVVENVNEEKIQSKYINKEELDKKIVNLIKQGEIEKAYNQIDDWYDYIKQRLESSKAEEKTVFEKYEIELPNEIKEKMHFIKNGYIDLSFENVFLNDNKYLFYDQEWYVENIPLEFILYRAINNLYTYNNKIEQILSKKQILEKYNLTESLDYFKQLEKQIQLEILDEKIVNNYRQENNNFYKNLEKLYEKSKKSKKVYLDLQQDFIKLKEEKEQIENNYEKLLNEYNTSRGWKIIKKFRKLLGKENRIK